jgi:hypothetical protein
MVAPPSDAVWSYGPVPLRQGVGPFAPVARIGLKLGSGGGC